MGVVGRLGIPLHHTVIGDGARRDLQTCETVMRGASGRTEKLAAARPGSRARGEMDVDQDSQCFFVAAVIAFASPRARSGRRNRDSEYTLKSAQYCTELRFEA